MSTTNRRDDVDQAADSRSKRFATTLSTSTRTPYGTDDPSAAERGSANWPPVS
ncbi:hypothetical protein AB0I39_28005 [Kitasatospora purpeofusca]|uniref:hypothetical protein n=1 Tax=Kitasatospora purpeofusca TaxID=67352 RepID=UPI0033E157EB